MLLLPKLKRRSFILLFSFAVGRDVTLLFKSFHFTVFSQMFINVN